MIEQLARRIDELAGQALPGIVDLRHRIHAEPEVGIFTEATADKVRSILSGTRIAFRNPIIRGDLVGDLDVGVSRWICLRAELDALPVLEATQLPYASTNPGAMHACGHDGHASILTGAALVLDSLADVLPVNIRFVFQPGEEMIAAGRILVEGGVCDGCDAAYALHGWPGLPENCICTKPGQMFAAGAHFTIILRGRGCHGAMPDCGLNPIPPAAKLVRNLADLHTRVSADGSVVSVCSVRAGDSSNVIPDHATILGTARYFDVAAGDIIERKIRSLAQLCESDFGVCVEVEYDRAYDYPVVNSKRGSDVAMAAAGLIPETQWREAISAVPTLEDFAYYLKSREGALVWLGLGEDWPLLHSPKFDFNDNVLKSGIRLLSLLPFLS